MVAQVLQSTRVRTTVLRAANIIGAGGAPFEMLRHLVERLPVMVCPRWIETRCQPIAVETIIEYLTGCLLESKTAGKTLDIGGPEIITYRQLMMKYARIRGLTSPDTHGSGTVPHLSSYWINFVTTVPAGVVMPLVEGLKNEVVCRTTKSASLSRSALFPWMKPSARRFRRWPKARKALYPASRVSGRESLASETMDTYRD